MTSLQIYADLLTICIVWSDQRSWATIVASDLDGKFYLSYYAILEGKISQDCSMPFP